MSHGHAHGHAGVRHRWRLAVAFGLVAAFFVVELVAGLTSGSLALLSDAGHMAADVVALGAALVATRIATRADRTGRRTFGSYRAEVFASGLAVLLMLGVSVYIAVEAVRRIGSSPEIASGTMLVVGAIGLVINVVALFLLRGGAAESLNVKGAYLEVVADTVGSVGVIAAALLVAATGSAWWDTVVALAIAVFVAVRASHSGARSSPSSASTPRPASSRPTCWRRSASVPGVTEVHDLHVWTLTSGMDVATAHLVTSRPDTGPEVLEAASRMLRERFHVAHATLQVETTDRSTCQGADW